MRGDVGFKGSWIPDFADQDGESLDKLWLSREAFKHQEVPQRRDMCESVNDDIKVVVILNIVHPNETCRQGQMSFILKLRHADCNPKRHIPGIYVFPPKSHDVRGSLSNRPTSSFEYFGSTTNLISSKLLLFTSYPSGNTYTLSVCTLIKT